MVAERERRARLVATIATILEIATRRIPVLPEDVPRIHARRTAATRRDRRENNRGKEEGRLAAAPDPGSQR